MHATAIRQKMESISCFAGRKHLRWIVLIWPMSLQKRTVHQVVRLRTGFGETWWVQAIRQNWIRTCTLFCNKQAPQGRDMGSLPGKEGIAFDNFQQMKMAIGAARVIEKELELREPWALFLFAFFRDLRTRREEKLRAHKRLAMECFLLSPVFVNLQDPENFRPSALCRVMLTVSLLIQVAKWCSANPGTRQPPLWIEKRAELLMECVYK